MARRTSIVGAAALFATSWVGAAPARGEDSAPAKKKSLRHLGALAPSHSDGTQARRRTKKKRGAKGGKSTKGSKSTSGGGLESELEKRYGFPMLSPEEIDATFDKVPSTYVTTYGLQNYNNPEFSVPLVDSFSTRGRVDLTWEEVQTVCVTKCDDSDVCQAVLLTSFAEQPGLKPAWECMMFNPELGDGAYRFDEPEGWRGKGAPASVLYTKKSSTAPIPAYEPCEVTVSDLQNDILCFLACSSDPTSCAACNLSQDFLDYIAPGAGCLLQEAAQALGSVEQGGAFLSGCLTCLTENGPYYDSGAVETCSVDPSNSLIRGTDECSQCGNQCYNIDDSTTLSAECEKKVQTALLCSTGSIPNVQQGQGESPDTFSGGNVNHPFVCPEGDMS